MAKNRTAIFFDDLTQKAQERIIEQEMEDIIPYVCIRSISIDNNLYGYDPDPKKQKVFQRIAVRLVGEDHRARLWLLEWDCMESMFTCFTPIGEEPENKIEGNLLKVIAGRSVCVYLPSEKED